MVTHSSNFVDPCIVVSSGQSEASNYEMRTNDNPATEYLLSRMQSAFTTLFGSVSGPSGNQSEAWDGVNWPMAMRGQYCVTWLANKKPVRNLSGLVTANQRSVRVQTNQCEISVVSRDQPIRSLAVCQTPLREALNYHSESQFVSYQQNNCHINKTNCVTLRGEVNPSSINIEIMNGKR